MSTMNPKIRGNRSLSRNLIQSRKSENVANHLRRGYGGQGVKVLPMTKANTN